VGEARNGHQPARRSQWFDGRQTARHIGHGGRRGGLAEPADYSVVAFGKDVVVPKSQESAKAGEAVVNDVLALRGFGTTDLAGALRTAGEQLSRSRAGRRIAVVLSDCRATVEGDVEAAARSLDEVVILAPADDDAEARVLAARIGARIAVIDGPSDVPVALQTVLGD